MGADDYAIVAAFASCLIQVSLWLMSVRAGYGADYVRLNWPHQVSPSNTTISIKRGGSIPETLLTRAPSTSAEAIQ